MGILNLLLKSWSIVKKNEVLSREQYYIDLLKPEYNILQKAGSSLGYKHTP